MCTSGDRAASKSDLCDNSFCFAGKNEPPGYIKHLTTQQSENCWKLARGSRNQERPEAKGSVCFGI